ncbi:MAG: endonuclease/exonuclease/phosphatase family protein, partial [Clostridia bacterium]|nr:endonuclease/exonuclease/phosphatase family protein [Clostridia bacterium]
SDTPTKMSKFEISPHYKGFSYAVLKDKATGAEFVYVAVHTSAGETRSEAIYKDNANLCREKQITVLKEQLETFAMYPIILGGDFNAKPTSKSLSILTSGTRYADATLIADEVTYTLPDNATHPTLCRDTGDNPYTELNENAQQIDYFFVTKDSITVQKFEEWDNPVNGKYPSDHIPVCAEITIFTN